MIFDACIAAAARRRQAHSPGNSEKGCHFSYFLSAMHRDSRRTDRGRQGRCARASQASARNPLLRLLLRVQRRQTVRPWLHLARLGRNIHSHHPPAHNPSKIIVLQPVSLGWVGPWTTKDSESHSPTHHALTHSLAHAHMHARTRILVCSAGRNAASRPRPPTTNHLTWSRRSKLLCLPQHLPYVLYVCTVYIC